MQEVARVDPDVLAAVQLALGDNPEAARIHLDALWHNLPPDDTFHRCVVAHYLADLQVDPLNELSWDRTALTLALESSPEAFNDRIPGITRESFLPSLHLNLAASHERVGQLDAARDAARAALASCGDAADTPLGDMTRSAISRICERLNVR